MPTENITISGDQSDLILTINITLPNDTVSVENVMVFVYTDGDIGGRLISRPVNTSGTTQASPESQMVRRFKLETANVTLASQLTKNSTTNRFKVRAMFKIALSCSTLYRQSYVIRKIVFVVTSRGKDDRRNEQQYVILYSKSVVPSPISTIVAGASSSFQNTGRPLATETGFLVRPTSPSVYITFPSASLTSSVVPTSVPTKVAQKTDGPPATGTSNTNVAIIAVPTVFVAVITSAVIASFMYYHKRKSSKIYDIQTAERPVSTNSEENYVESSV